MLDIILVKCRCYTQNKSKKKYPQPVTKCNQLGNK